jgi:S1-C subfamily serine protease
MKLRRLILVALIVGGFLYLTTRGGFVRRVDNGIDRIDRIAGSHGLPLELTEAHAAPNYDSEETNNIGVYKKALPSVVNITSSAVAFDFFYGLVPQQGQGSGFILDKAGHILTNYHVVADARLVEVTLSDKHKYKAQVVGRDQGHDLAMLQINAPNLTPAVLASSHDLQVGQKVYAIGNPFGLSGTMTTGIISAIRSIRGPQGHPIENAIQTDAAINPGNSGGPLLNSRGEVIGINSMIATNPNQDVEQSAGIGFAIPIDTAKAVLSDFQRYGRVRRPSLGIVSLPIGPDLANQMGLAADYGVLIQRTLPGGAAERAGLHGGSQQAYLGNQAIFLGGDLIVAIDSHDVTSIQDISEIMDAHQAGDTVTVTVYRGRRKLSVQVTLGEAHETAA